MSRFVKINSSSVLGLEARLIEIEIDIQGGLSSFNIVGLPDKAVEESKERVISAIKNSGAESPLKKSRRITVNLAPADLKKEGSLFDLPIAVGFLSASNQLDFSPRKKLFVGELALDGRLRSVDGVLAVALLASKRNYEELYLPTQNAKEATVVDGIDVYGVPSLDRLVSHLEGDKVLSPELRSEIKSNQNLENQDNRIDFAQIKGQKFAKRALEVAAAGNHNVLLSGPPGSGKTVLARGFANILPRLDREEALEVTRIFSVAGLLSGSTPLRNRRPFRHPHHSSSSVSLIGGGTYPSPGEVTLAHRGVLFLDEFPEFQRNVMEALRQPLEDKEVTISRAAGTVTFPANFTLVAAMNPCPCGFLNDPDKECKCSSAQITRYRRKISGPILDRIDIHVEVPRIRYEEMASDESEESSDQIRRRIEKARETQKQRFQANEELKTNSEMNNKKVKKFCSVGKKAQSLLKTAVEEYSLSARSYFRILKVARTIADLENNSEIQEENVSEAIQLRIKNNESL